MKIPTVTELVKNNNLAQFDRCEDRTLWYAVHYNASDTGYVLQFEFPISIDDTAGGVFRAHDKALFFMRWIRKHVEFLNDSVAAADEG